MIKFCGSQCLTEENGVHLQFPPLIRHAEPITGLNPRQDDLLTLQPGFPFSALGLHFWPSWLQHGNRVEEYIVAASVVMGLEGNNARFGSLISLWTKLWCLNRFSLIKVWNHIDLKLVLMQIKMTSLQSGREFSGICLSSLQSARLGERNAVLKRGVGTRTAPWQRWGNVDQS